MLTSHSTRAADEPFLLTYSHQMEEPGNPEIETKILTARPTAGNRFVGVPMELEYSSTSRWTTSVYLDGQANGSQSALFTGYRWENRFRLFPREHWINPVLYVEYANLDAADRTLVQVVGHDNNGDLIQPNQIAHREKDHEIEAKLILGTCFKEWTIAENFLGEKNLSNEPFEFGYSVGISRPLALASHADPCNLCAKNFQAGVEVYGGVGTAQEFNFHGTSHYIAPVVSWALPSGTTFRVPPGFGVSGASDPMLVRFGVSYGIDKFGHAVRGLFGHMLAPVTP